MTKANPKPKVGGPRVRPKNPVRRVRKSALTSEPRPRPTEADYEVGYKRPPKSTQFKPGVSGNPKGRPKGSKSFETDFLKEMGQKLSTVENGRRRKLTKQQILAKKVINDGLTGSQKQSLDVLKFSIGLEQQAQARNKSDGPAMSEVAKDSKRILSRMRRKFEAESRCKEDDDDSDEAGED